MANLSWWFGIQNVQSGRVMDVQGNAKKAGTTVWPYSLNYTNAQIFRVDTTPPPREYGDDACYIEALNPDGPDLCLSVKTPPLVIVAADTTEPARPGTVPSDVILPRTDQPSDKRVLRNYAFSIEEKRGSSGTSPISVLTNLSAPVGPPKQVWKLVPVPGEEDIGTGDITTEWGSVKPPPVPELKPVTVDSKTTALLVLDMMKGNCGVRPRCQATVPSIKKLIDTAHAHKVAVLYNLTGRNSTVADMIDQSLAPKPGDVMIKDATGADKFITSDLDQLLKARGIKTVIVTGTSAQGAVGGTSNGAAQRGYKAVVPVDGMSSEDSYNEQYAAWHLYKGGPAVLVENVTLTRGDLIKFAD
jgi:nicotinamidase-related amidase